MSEPNSADVSAALAGIRAHIAGIRLTPATYQDSIAEAMNRRIQDSALRAARLLAQHNEERQHTEDLQAEYSEYRATVRGIAVTRIDEGEDG